MATGAAKATLKRRTIQLVELWGSRIDHQILRRALGVVAARVRQRLEQADLIGAHTPILCPCDGGRTMASCVAFLSDQVQVAQHHHDEADQHRQ